MTKLTRHERIRITRKINYALDNYCQAGCPHANQSTLSPVCKTCPINLKLRGYGKELGMDDAVERKKSAPVKWTPEETDYLKQAYGKIPTSKIAEKLNRTETAIYRRIHNIKELIK